ncbi:MAG: hypothetical protein HZB55_17240 [Deltaproteobacteria bacterium]|nr:hypothetical protein [Deltaproteobacteria bacterium]
MSRRIFRLPLRLLIAAAALSLGMNLGICVAADGGNGPAKGGKGVTHDEVMKKFNKVSPAEQKAAAKRARGAGLLPGVAGRAPAGSEGRPRDRQRGD